MEKDRTYNRFVGFDHDGNLIFLDYTFGEAPRFHGATGYRLEPWTQSRVDAILKDPDTKESYEDTWRAAVQAEQTLQSFDDWYDDYAANIDDEYELAGIDDSFYYGVEDKVHELVPDAVVTNAIECGRMFPEALDDIDMSKPHDDEAMAIIRAAEAGNEVAGEAA